MSIAEKLTTVAENQEKVYDAGQTAEYDRFWNAFQDNGNRTDYEKAFFHKFWNDTIYNPKYPIVASVTASQMFDAAHITDTKVPIEIRDGVADMAFVRCSRLVTIPLLKLTNVTKFSNTFAVCSKLENITIEGSIDVNFNISATAVLTNESVQSIIDHLKDLTGATTQTLTFHADVGAKLTDEQKASITAKNWTLAY